jgi:hypothetical protein
VTAVDGAFQAGMTCGGGGGARRAGLAGASFAGTTRTGTAGGAGARARPFRLTFGKATTGIRTGGDGSSATAGGAFTALTRVDADADADARGRVGAGPGCLRVKWGTGGVRCKLGICSLRTPSRPAKSGCRDSAGAADAAAGSSKMALRLIVTPDNPWPPIKTVGCATAIWLPSAATKAAKNSNGRQDIRARCRI